MMKNTLIINGNWIAVILFSFVALLACQPKVLFYDAVPPGIDKIDKIPFQFQGVYVCQSDSSRMFADEFAVYKESYRMFITTIEKVEQTEDCAIVAGGLYLPGRKECIPFDYIEDDKIVAKIYSIDTLFGFRKDEVLKLYKGRLFLNYQSEKNEWVCHMITPMRDRSMKWELINVPDEVNTIEEVTVDYTTRENKEEETLYVIKPTLVEFDQILDKNFVSDCDILYPINFEL